MGKTTTKTKAMTVSWRTLARRAAEATNPRQAALLRKEAATLRRTERAAAKKAVKKTAKKTAKSAAKKPAGASKRIMDGARELPTITMYFDPAERRWAKVADSQQAAVLEAARKTEADVIQRRDDALVCSWLNVTEAHQIGGGLTPMLVPSEIVRALERVLERAGYTICGRRSSDDTTDKGSVAKAA